MRPRALSLLAVVLLLAACDNTNPTQPLTLDVMLEAEPATMSVGEASTITISAFGPEGNPGAGAPVKMETSLGKLTRVQFRLDPSGEATSTLQSTAESGTATISAVVTVQGVEYSATIEVEIIEP